MRHLLLIFAMLTPLITYGQNQSVIVINNNAPVIERVKYVEKYRIIYRDKPEPKRVAKKLDTPVMLLGNICVFTEDLGDYKCQKDAVEILQYLNKQKFYDRDDWRIPTSAELTLMENYAEEVGLGSDIYLCLDHRNGILRPVSTGKTVSARNFEQKQKEEQERQETLRKERQQQQRQDSIQRAKQREIEYDERIISSGEGILLGNLIWSKLCLGAKSLYDMGTYHDYSNKRCPEGWRLPNRSELSALKQQATYKRGVIGEGNDKYVRTYYQYDDIIIYDIAYMNSTDKGSGHVRCVRDITNKN